MKKSDVPQEQNVTFAGGFKAVYALGEDGRYVVTPSSGWKVEETVTLMAVEEFRRQAEGALQRAVAGDSSPLDYHMYARRMDLPTLAQAVGMFTWRVRRHLRPGVFGKLDRRTLERYAEALGMTVEQLRGLPR